MNNTLVPVRSGEDQEELVMHGEDNVDYRVSQDEKKKNTYALKMITDKQERNSPLKKLSPSMSGGHS